MASLVLGAIGGFFFGPIGFLAGSLLGNLLFPGKTEGPRLQNLKLQGSSYGSFIPITYGSVRVAGQVVWQTDLKEHKHTSGGKGGPQLHVAPAPFSRIVRARASEDGSGGKGGPQVTTYSYSASFAVKLCKGTKGGVSRIWANGTTIYDTTISGAGSVDNSKVPVTIYVGEESANPDPTMEAELGVGNVPAFRDDCAVVLTDWDLSEYGNTIPQLSFEIFDASGPIPWRVSTFEPFNTSNGSTDPGKAGPQDGRFEDGKLVISKWTDTPPFTGGTTIGFEIKTFDINGNELSDDARTGNALPVDDGVQNTHFRPCLNNPHIAYAYANGANRSGYYYEETIAWQGAILGSDAYGCPFQNPVYSKIVDAVYNLVGSSTAALVRFPCSAGVPTSEFATASYSLWTHPGVDATNHPAGTWSISIDEETGNVWALAGNHGGPTSSVHLIKFDPDLNVLHDWIESDLPGGTAFTTADLAFTVWSDVICLTLGPTPGDVVTAYYIDPVAYTFTETDPGTINSFAPYVSSPSQVISLGNGLALVGNGIISLAPKGGPVTRGSIVSDLCVRAGLTTGQIDVTQLTDLVDGFIVSTQADCRTDIEPLRSIVPPFDAVESSGKIKFVVRGGVPAVTIPDNDLAAQQRGEQPPPLLEIKRAQEVDLPAVVNVSYLNIGAAYQDGSQQARRQVGLSQAVSSVQLAIVMSDLQARTIANVLLFGTWVERMAFSFRTSRKYDYLEPTDIVIVRGYEMRITRKMEGVAGVLQFDALQTFASLYLAAPAGNATSGYVPSFPPTTQKTNALLLDIPLIADTDDANGFYEAAAGAVDATWRGMTLNESRDSGTTYFPIATDSVADVIGTTSDILGDWLGGDIFDPINSVTVVIGVGGGTLSSATMDAVINGANIALIGDELVQFMTATLTAPSTYVLSGFLRGRQGTDARGATYNPMASHAAGERFVLLPTNDVARPFSDLALPWLYKAVSSGDSLAATGAVTFTNTGARLRCYSPVQLGGGVDDLGAIILTWNRRTRIGGLWLNFVDALLSESTEAYVLNFYSDNTFATVVQTFNITPASFFTPGQPSFKWTLADQNDAFGSYPQAFAYWGVSQVGTLGPGIESRQTTP